MKKKELYIRFVFLIFILVANAQNDLNLKNYSLPEGLSHYKVQSIFKDRDGFLWIGTEDGLNKFDGVNCIIFQNVPDDQTTLSSGNIFSITQDKKGFIWVAVDGGGVNIIDPHTHKITKIFSENDTDRLRYVKHIFIDQDIAWISAWGGLIRFDINRRSYKVFKLNENSNSISNSDVKQVTKDQDGLLWLATAGGLNSYDIKSNRFDSYMIPNTTETVLANSVRHIFCDSNNTLWLGTEDGGLYNFNKKTNQFSKIYHDEKNHVNCFYEDTKKNLYIGNQKGIDRLKLNSNYTSFTLKNSSIVDFGVAVITNNKDGLFIIGSVSKGIYVLKKNIFKTLFVSPKNDIVNRIRTIIKGTNNTVWFGTIGHGIIQFNSETNTTTTLLADTPIKNYIIERLFIDSEQNLWIGTYANGLFKYHFKTKKLTPILKTPLRIEYLFESKDKVLWIATNKGTQFYDGNLNQIINAPSKYKLPKEALTSHQIHFIKYDNQGRIWYNVAKNLYVFDPKKSTTKQLRGIQNTYEYISFTQTTDGVYYLGTLNGGIVRIDAKGNVQTITVKDGLISNRITDIQTDKNNTIWYSTTKGIGAVIFENNKATFKNYTHSDGIQDLEFYLGSSFKDEKGLIYFGGVGGVTYFNPDAIKTTKNTQQTLINEISIFNKKIKTDTIIPLKKRFDLNYDDDFIHLKFNSIGFSEQTKYKYKYRLLGLNDVWSTENTDNSVSYTNLQPGKYLFEVKSTNGQGIWNNTPAQIEFRITPPFWNTWWFYLIEVLVAVTLFLIAIKIRERKIVNEAKTAQFKLQALRSQMNPHFIFNALNSIQHFIIKNDTKFALKYLTLFSKLVRKILENSFHIRIPLSEEIKFLSNYIEIESLRFDNKIDFSIEIDPEIDVEAIEIPSMLIQPYVENSILHGLMPKEEEGIIKITLHKQGKLIKCTIEDNGIGRLASKKNNLEMDKTHQSFGLPITKSRLDELNKASKTKVTINIEDIIEDYQIKGTRVELFIPID